MKAKYLVQRYAHSLIGKTVLTERIGEWPGGPAEVIKLNPDPAAPEVVMTVRHKTATDPMKPSRYWEMGVFEHENLELFATPPENDADYTDLAGRSWNAAIE